MSPVASRRRIALAQNFIRDRTLIDRLIRRSSLTPEDTVLEVGPGAGAITASLAQRCGHVIAIEKDPNLAARLRRRFGAAEHVSIQHADFLETPLPSGEYKVFANIPFNITTAIVAKLTTGQDPPRDAYLVMQREAAEKFLGAPRESLASLLLKPWFDVSLFYRFHRDDFFPAPGVDVVMLHLHRRHQPLVAPRDARLYRDLITHLFTNRQPTVRATLLRLVSPFTLSRTEHRINRRLDRTPTTIPFPEWLSLLHAFRAEADRHALRAVAGAESALRRHQANLKKVHRTRSVPARRS